MARALTLPALLVFLLLLAQAAAPGQAQPSQTAGSGGQGSILLEYNIGITANASFAYFPFPAEEANWHPPANLTFIIFRNATVKLVYQPGSPGTLLLELTVRDAIRQVRLDRVLEEEPIGDVAYRKVYTTMETPLGVLVYEGDRFVGILFYYITGPLRLDQPVQRLVMPPRANTPFFSSICHMSLNITEVAAEHGFLDLIERLRLVWVGTGTFEADLGALRPKITYSNPDIVFSVLNPCSFGPVVPIVTVPSEAARGIGPLEGVYVKAVQGVIYNETRVVELAPDLKVVFIDSDLVLVFVPYKSLHFAYIFRDLPFGFEPSDDLLAAFRGPNILFHLDDVYYHESGVLARARLRMPIDYLGALLFLTVADANYTLVAGWESAWMGMVNATVELVKAVVPGPPEPIVAVESGPPTAEAATAIAAMALSVVALVVSRRAPD